MAWKRFCYSSEVSGLIHKYNNRMITWLALALPLLLVSIVYYPLLELSDCHFNIFFLSKMFLFFHVEDNGILVEYAYSFLRLIFNTAQLMHFITAHSSLTPAKMCSVTPLF